MTFLALSLLCLLLARDFETGPASLGFKVATVIFALLEILGVMFKLALNAYQRKGGE